MNRWRYLIVLLVILGIGFLVARPWLFPDAGNIFHNLRSAWLSQPTFRPPPLPPRFPYLVSALGKLLSLYLTGALLLFVFPRSIRRMEKALTQPILSLVRMAIVGLLCGLLVVFLVMSSSFTMVTFPLTVFLGLVLLASSFVGVISLVYTIGHWLLKRAHLSQLSPMVSLLLGLLVVFALSEIPYFGWLVNILLASLGLGVVVATRFGSGETWTLTPLDTE